MWFVGDFHLWLLEFAWPCNGLVPEMFVTVSNGHDSQYALLGKHEVKIAGYSPKFFFFFCFLWAEPRWSLAGKIGRGWGLRRVLSHPLFSYKEYLAFATEQGIVLSFLSLNQGIQFHYLASRLYTSRQTSTDWRPRPPSWKFFPHG